MADDDKELFESALDEPTAEVIEPEPQERPRDEHGRFAPKVEAEPEPEPEPQPEPQKPDTQGIPSWRLKEEAEARRAAEERAADLQRRIAEYERQQKPQEEKPAPEPWDPGYDEYVRKPLVEQMQKQNEMFSMRMAVKDHGRETVEAAYSALGQAVQSGDPAANAELQRIKASQDPYEDIVQWHRRQTVLSTVGNDPNAWFEKQLEERLKDPTHQTALLERIRGQAAGPRPPVTQLPPSLNKATAARASIEEDDDSDAGLLKSSLRR